MTGRREARDQRVARLVPCAESRAAEELVLAHAAQDERVLVDVVADRDVVGVRADPAGGHRLRRGHLAARRRRDLPHPRRQLTLDAVEEIRRVRLDEPEGRHLHELRVLRRRHRATGTRATRHAGGRREAEAGP